MEIIERMNQRQKRREMKLAHLIECVYSNMFVWVCEYALLDGDSKTDKEYYQSSVMRLNPLK